MANDPNMLNLPMRTPAPLIDDPLGDLYSYLRSNYVGGPYAQPLVPDFMAMTPEQREQFLARLPKGDPLYSEYMSQLMGPITPGIGAIKKGAGLAMGRGAFAAPPAGGASVQQVASRSLGANPGSAMSALRGSKPLGKMNVSGSLPTGQTPFPSNLPQAPRAGLNLRGNLPPEQAIKMQGSGVGLGNVPRSSALKTSPTPGVKYGAGPGRQATYPIQKPRELARQQFSDLMTSSPQRVPAGMQSPIAPLTEAYSKLSAPAQRLLPLSAGTGLAAGVLSRPDAPAPDTNAELAAAYQRMQNQSSPLMSEEAMSMMPPASPSAVPGVPASIAGNVTPFRDDDMPAPAASIAAQMPGQTAGVPGGYQVRSGDMLADIATADLAAKGKEKFTTADVMRRVQELQKEIGITDPRKLQTFAQSGAPIKSVAANISPAGAYAKRFGTAKAAKPAPKPAVQPAKPKFMRQPLLSDFSVEENRPISKTGAARTGLQSPRDGLFQMMSQAVDQQLPRPAAAPKPATPEQRRSMNDMGKALGALDLSSDPTPPVGNLRGEEDKTFPATKMGTIPKTQSISTPGFPLKTPASRFIGKDDVPVQTFINATDIEPVPFPRIAFGGGTDMAENVYAKGGEISDKSNPALWAASKSEALNKMGGKHSARAMQLATSIYQKKGGKYKGGKSSKNRLANWGKQNMEKGGEVVGGVPGVDSVPILAQQGEYVIPKPIVDSIKTGMPMPTDSVEMMGEMRQMLSNWNPTTEEGKKYHKEVEMLLAKKSSNFPMMKYGGKVMNMPQMMYGGAVKKKTKMTGY